MEAAAPEHLIKIRPSDRSLGGSRAGGQIRLALAALPPSADVPAQGSDSIVQRWRSGGLCRAELLPLHERMRHDPGWARPSSPSMRQRWQCSIPDAGEPRRAYFWTMARDDAGLWAGLILPVSSTPMRRGAVLYTRLICSADYHGIVQCDGTEPTEAQIKTGSCLPSAAHLRRRFQPISPRKATRRSPRKRSSASPSSTRSKRQSAADPRRTPCGAPGEEQAAGHGLARLARNAARQSLRQIAHCRGDPLRPPITGRLVRFARYGRISSTTTSSSVHENVALTRKNALFAGHDDGAENWACIRFARSKRASSKASTRKPTSPMFSPASSTCAPNNRLDELLPWTWAMLAGRNNAPPESAPVNRLARVKPSAQGVQSTALLCSR